MGRLLPKEKPRRLTYSRLDTALELLQEIERVDARERTTAEAHAARTSYPMVKGMFGDR